MSCKPAKWRVSDRLAKIAVTLLGCALPQLNSFAEIGIVAPNNLANTEGNSADSTPFGNLGPIRWQQVYDASQFSAISLGGAWINAVLFRSDSASTHGFAAIVSNLQINLSSTTKVPDGLSTVFAENVGPDDKIVFGPGLSILEAPHSSTSPQLFLAQVSFSTPFFYDPRRGNLLMDIRNYSGEAFGGSVGNLDGVLTMGDSISRVAGFLNSDSAFISDSFGFVTQFEVTTVPEPSSVLLLLIGAVPVGFWFRRERRRKGVPG